MNDGTRSDAAESGDISPATGKTTRNSDVSKSSIAVLSSKSLGLAERVRIADAPAVLSDGHLDFIPTA
jgi:hypothetical protein